MCRSVACIEISHSNIQIDIKEAATEKLTHIEGQLHIGDGFYNWHIQQSAVINTTSGSM